MLTYAIGDLQGCYTSLQKCLDQINLHAPNATLLFVGDLINRGPASLSTLRTIKNLGQRAKIVLGNHDLHLLSVACGIRTPHPKDTLNEILHAPDLKELLDWMRQQPLALQHKNYLMVHAGVIPSWNTQQTLDLAQEIHLALISPNWKEFLENMYGNTVYEWNDNLKGYERLRYIVNVLTRIRFCTEQGIMDFKNKKGIANASPGYYPWFDVPNRKTENTPIICGHWSSLGLVQRDNLLALDSGCVWGGKLSAVCLENRHTIQIDCAQCQTIDN